METTDKTVPEWEAVIRAYKQTADDWQDMATVWRRRAKAAEALVEQLKKELEDAKRGN